MSFFAWDEEITAFAALVFVAILMSMVIIVGIAWAHGPYTLRAFLDDMAEWMKR